MADKDTKGGQRWGPHFDPPDYGKPPHPKPDPDMMCSHSIHHVIQRGDTFFNLAQRYGVDVNEIIAMNPCATPRNLQIGQIVCIPCPCMPMDP